MFNEMICSRCKDIVSITSTSVELPFLCEECIEAENSEVEGLVATPEPTDETATVENTTLLIADLEQQIADSKEALDKSTELIGDLTEQLAKAKENLGLYDEAGRVVTGLLLAANMERNELIARIARLDRNTKTLWDNNDALSDRVKKYHQRGLEEWKKSYFYENLGFWGRLFNYRYSDKLIDPRGF